MTGASPPSCEAQPAPDALLDCAWDACRDECFVEDSSSSSSSGSGGGDDGSCSGPASTTGAVAGVTPDVTVGRVVPDPTGRVQVVLSPALDISAGDVVVGVFFFPASGQTSYPPNGDVGCAVLEYTESGYSVVDTTKICEVNLTTLEFASRSGVCDGQMTGGFRGVFSGNSPLAGTFSVPFDLTESDVAAPACQRPDGPCSSNSDCCSGSCSIVLGVCN
ncbi:hypothetical protein WMF37_33650 [Sorangium sp. So ce291]|uniref:hypothetical protein n=1 Tax=Sorangium sp. So ce291 TaxID=3133294 RepID=UPI003F5F3BAA